MNTICNKCSTCGAGYDALLHQCPYCNSSDALTLTLKPLVFDTECYAQYWLFEALDPFTCGRVWDAGDPAPPECESVRRQEYLRFIGRVFGVYVKEKKP